MVTAQFEGVTGRLKGVNVPSVSREGDNTNNYDIHIPPGNLLKNIRRRNIEEAGDAGGGLFLTRPPYRPSFEVS